MSFLPAVKIWLWASVFASVAGWTLSLFGQLNWIGYLAIMGVGGFVLLQAVARGAIKFPSPRGCWPKLHQRCSRPFPLIFLALAILVLLGGLLYPPTNHTGLSYRIPRVLHWLGAGEWHWIYAPNHRMNTRACGIEWLSTPLLLFLKSDRGLFLLNFFPFLLLPGLTFSVLTRFGVRARVAWQWMWLLPTGHVFLLQAGSAGNDAYPAIYALAAVDFALRAWTSRRVTDLWHSLLAIALLNGAKASNLPLTLVWLVIVFPLWRLLRQQPLGTARIAALALIVSFLPTAALNVSHCGDWSGLSLERPGMNMKNPFVGVGGNTVFLLLNNFCPPFFPLAGWWNQHILQHVPGFLLRPLLANFEEGFHFLWELPTEDWAGIGPGISLLLAVAAWWTLKGMRQRDNRASSRLGISPRLLRFAWWSPWIGLLAYCAKSGMVTPARLIAPYYPLLLPLLLVGAGQSVLVRTRGWRWLCSLVFLTAFAVLIVTPARPLWPAQTILKRAVAAQPDSRLLNRALTTYTVYSQRSDPHAEVRAQLPAGLQVIGFLGGPDDLEISFWRPYGTRRVEAIALEAPPEEIRQRKIEYAVVSGLFLELQRATFAEWSARTRAELIAQTNVTLSVSIGPKPWYVVRFKE